MMNFGGALEALKSGEAVERKGVTFRYSPRGFFIQTKDGVSTSVGAMPVESIFAEDWKIAGYAQAGEKGHGFEQDDGTDGGPESP